MNLAACSIPSFSSWDHSEATKTMENIHKRVIFSKTGRHTQKYLQDLQFTQEQRRRRQRKTKRDASSSKFQRAPKEEWSVHIQTAFSKMQDLWGAKALTLTCKQGSERAGGSRSPFPQWAWFGGSWKERTSALCFPQPQLLGFFLGGGEPGVDSYLFFQFSLSFVWWVRLTIFIYFIPQSSDWTFHANKGLQTIYGSNSP